MDPEEDERSFLSIPGPEPQGSLGTLGAKVREGTAYPPDRGKQGPGSCFIYMFFFLIPQIQGDLPSSPLAAL